MSTCCPKPLRTKVAEWDILDSCGRPKSGGGLTDAVIRSNAFTELTVTPDIEEGTKIRVTNAGGEICINDEDDAQIVGYNLGLKLCGVPMPVMIRLLGLRELTDGDEDTPSTIGGAMPIGKISRDPQALHLWMQNKVKGDCGGGGSRPFVEFLLPWTWRWRPDGDLTFANGNLEFGLKGYAEDNPNFSRGYSTAGYATNWTTADAVVEALLWKCVSGVPAAVECDYIDGLVPS